jgi:hypothetical protein
VKRTSVGNASAQSAGTTAAVDMNTERLNDHQINCPGLA